MNTFAINFMKDEKKNIILKGNKKLNEKLTVVLTRKEKVKQLILNGASIEKIRKLAPLSM